MSLVAEIEALEAATLARVAGLSGDEALEHLRVEVLGRKGALTSILRGLKDVPADERPEIGERANAAKRAIEERIEAAQAAARTVAEAARLEREVVDVTLPARSWPRGRRHPLLRTMEEAIDIFERMGFEVVESPEIEDDEHNFEALNFPDDHPARDMQDTFLLEDGRLLRTHCTPSQVHVMRTRKPPLAVITPGATYRRDDLDLTHAPMFHQIEGLWVDREVSFADLKGVVTQFLQRFFERATAIEDIFQIAHRRQTHQDFEIGESKIRIEQHHPRTLRHQRRRQIDGNRRFTHATLPARDSKCPSHGSLAMGDACCHSARFRLSSVASL